MIVKTEKTLYTNGNILDGGFAMHKKNIWLLICAAVVCCGIMAVVDGIIQPGYAVKSAIKIGLFLMVPYLVSRLGHDLHFARLFRFCREGILPALGLGIGVYAVILGGYFVLRNWIDFSGIVDSLSSGAGVTKDNFLFVSLYISFINSLLEEFFFRGFLFANLKAASSRRFAYGFSSLMFALYHVAMMIGWFHPALTLLLLVGLTVGGMLFNFLNEKQETIYTSWLVHMFANFAINTVGFILMA